MLLKFVLFFLLCSLCCLCDNLKTIARFLNDRERELIKSYGLIPPSNALSYRALLVQSDSLPTATYDTRLRRILARPFTRMPQAASAVLEQYRNSLTGAERQKLFCAFRREIIASIERTLTAISLKNQLLKKPRAKKSTVSNTSGGLIDLAGRISVPPTGPNSNFNNSEEDEEEESFSYEGSSPIDLEGDDGASRDFGGQILDSRLIEEEDEDCEVTRTGVQCEANLQLNASCLVDGLDRTDLCALKSDFSVDELELEDRCEATFEFLEEAEVLFESGRQLLDESAEFSCGSVHSVHDENSVESIEQMESDTSVRYVDQMESDTSVRYIDQMESDTSVLCIDQSQSDTSVRYIDQSQTDTSIINESQIDSSIINLSQTDTSIINLSQTDNSNLSHTDTSIIYQSQTDTSIINQSHTDTSVINLDESLSPEKFSAHTPSQNNPTRIRKIPTRSNDSPYKNSSDEDSLSIRKMPTTQNKKCSSEKSHFLFDEQQAFEFSNILLRNYLSDRSSKKNNSIDQSSRNYKSYSPRTEDIKRRLDFASSKSERLDFSSANEEFNAELNESFDQQLMNLSDDFEQFEAARRFRQMVRLQYEQQEKAIDFNNLLDRALGPSVSSEENVEFDCAQSRGLYSGEHSEEQSEQDSSDSNSQNTVVVRRGNSSRDYSTPGRMFWNNSSDYRIESLRRNNPRGIFVSSYGSDSANGPRAASPGIGNLLGKKNQRKWIKSHPHPIRTEAVEARPLPLRTRIWNWIKSWPLISALCAPMNH